MTYQEDGTGALARRMASCDTLPEQAVIAAYQQEEMARARTPEAMSRWVERLRRIGLSTASADTDIADLFLLSTTSHKDPTTVSTPATSCTTGGFTNYTWWDQNNNTSARMRLCGGGTCTPYYDTWGY